MVSSIFVNDEQLIDFYVHVYILVLTLPIVRANWKTRSFLFKHIFSEFSHAVGNVSQTPAKGPKRPLWSTNRKAPSLPQLGDTSVWLLIYTHAHTRTHSEERIIVGRKGLWALFRSSFQQHLYLSSNMWTTRHFQQTVLPQPPTESWMRGENFNMAARFGTQLAGQARAKYLANQVRTLEHWVPQFLCGNLRGAFTPNLVIQWIISHQDPPQPMHSLRKQKKFGSGLILNFLVWRFELSFLFVFLLRFVNAFLFSAELSRGHRRHWNWKRNWQVTSVFRENLFLRSRFLPFLWALAKPHPCQQVNLVVGKLSRWHTHALWDGKLNTFEIYSNTTKLTQVDTTLNSVPRFVCKNSKRWHWTATLFLPLPLPKEITVLTQCCHAKLRPDSPHTKQNFTNL